MHSIPGARSEQIGDVMVARTDPTSSLAALVEVFRRLHFDLIVLDAQLEPLVVIGRAAEAALARLSRARRRDVAQRVAAGAFVMLRLDDEAGSEIELGACALAGGVGIFVAGPGHQRFPACEGLRRLYGLTPTEAKVARAISGGRSPKEIAGDLAVELSTVRSHLRAVHIKLGAASQADLVRRLLSSIATFASDAENNDHSPSLVTIGDATPPSNT